MQAAPSKSQAGHAAGRVEPASLPAVAAAAPEAGCSGAVHSGAGNWLSVQGSKRTKTFDTLNTDEHDLLEAQYAQAQRTSWQAEPLAAVGKIDKSTSSSAASDALVAASGRGPAGANTSERLQRGAAADVRLPIALASQRVCNSGKQNSGQALPGAAHHTGTAVPKQTLLQRSAQAQPRSVQQVHHSGAESCSAQQIAANSDQPAIPGQQNTQGEKTGNTVQPSEAAMRSWPQAALDRSNDHTAARRARIGSKRVAKAATSAAGNGSATGGEQRDEALQGTFEACSIHTLSSNACDDLQAQYASAQKADRNTLQAAAAVITQASGSQAAPDGLPEERVPGMINGRHQRSVGPVQGIQSNGMDTLLAAAQLVESAASQDIQVKSMNALLAAAQHVQHSAPHESQHNCMDVLLAAAQHVNSNASHERKLNGINALPLSAHHVGHAGPKQRILQYMESVQQRPVPVACRKVDLASASPSPPAGTEQLAPTSADVQQQMQSKTALQLLPAYIVQRLAAADTAHLQAVLPQQHLRCWTLCGPIVKVRKLALPVKLCTYALQQCDDNHPL